MTHQSRWVGSIVSMVLLSPGCAESGPGLHDAVIRDSAGIRIVEFHESVSRHGVRVIPDPAFEVRESLEFGRIAGVHGSEDGLVAVLDAMNARVTVLDQAGHVVSSFGGAGEGPGQFNPRGLASVVWANGAILVPDLVLQRVSRFGLDGRVVDTYPLPLSEGLAHDWRPGADGSQVFRLYRPGGDAIVRVQESLTDTLYQFDEHPAPPNMVLARIPLWALLRSGDLAVGHTHAYEVSLWGPGQGSPDWIVRRPSKVPEVTEDERQHLRQLLEVSLLRRTGGDLSPEMRERMLSQTRLPHQAPVISALHAGPNETLWVGWARPISEMGEEILRVGGAEGLGSGQWDVLDRNGMLLGTVMLPDGIELKAIVGSYIYGAGSDEVGVQTVERLRVQFD